MNALNTKLVSSALLDYSFRPRNFQLTVIELNKVSSIALVYVASAEVLHIT